MSIYQPSYNEVTVKAPRKAMFIDDISKSIIFTDTDDEMVRYPGAFWIPALGYTKSWDNFDGHIYISGATGSGKSYLIKKTILNDQLSRKCILFTDLNRSDPTLEGVNFFKFDENGKYNWDWVNENDSNKIMVFDDVQYNENILKYRDYMLEKGRHKGTVVICVNHRLQDYHKTKVALNDARFIVTFPCSNKGNVKRYLEYEFGMEKQDVQSIVALACKEGRHLIIHKFHPVTIATTETIIRL